MAVHAHHHELCGQAITWATAPTFGRPRTVAFTRKPAILYHLVPGEDETPQAVRTEAGLTLYTFHDAVCPFRPPVTSTLARAFCSSCKRPIIWCLSPAGQRMPLDAEPVTAYRFEEQYVDLRAVEYPLPHEAYLSHFATCPNVAAHRKKPARR